MVSGRVEKLLSVTEEQIVHKLAAKSWGCWLKQEPQERKCTKHRVNIFCRGLRDLGDAMIVYPFTD
jgi:hypothetical protein